MKPLIIFLVTTLLFFYPLFSLPSQNPSPQQQEKKDEIQKLKKQMLHLLQGLDEKKIS